MRVIGISITSFCFQFPEHAQYPGVHGNFDNDYSYEIPNLDELFVAGVLRTEIFLSVLVTKFVHLVPMHPIRMDQSNVLIFVLALTATMPRFRNDLYCLIDHGHG